MKLGINTLNLLNKSTLDRAFELTRWSLIMAAVAICTWAIFQNISVYLSTQAEIFATSQKIKTALLNAGQIKASEKERSDLRPLINKNLFAPLTEIPLTGIEIQKPKQDVPLALIGTFITKGQSPYAIIENKKASEQDVFELEQGVFDVAKLIEINSTSVKIERDGQIEILELEDGGGLGESSDGESSGGGAAGETIKVDAAELDNALNNLPLLLTQARAVPYFKDGASVGLRMFAIRPGSLYEKIGLKNGDILKAINGSSLADITQAIKLFEKLKEEKKISLSMERNMQEQNMNYVIE